SILPSCASPPPPPAPPAISPRDGPAPVAAACASLFNLQGSLRQLTTSAEASERTREVPRHPRLLAQALDREAARVGAVVGTDPEIAGLAADMKELAAAISRGLQSVAEAREGKRDADEQAALATVLATMKGGDPLVKRAQIRCPVVNQPSGRLPPEVIQ